MSSLPRNSDARALLLLGSACRTLPGTGAGGDADGTDPFVTSCEDLGFDEYLDSRAHLECKWIYDCEPATDSWDDRDECELYSRAYDEGSYWKGEFDPCAGQACLDGWLAAEGKCSDDDWRAATAMCQPDVVAPPRS